MVFRRDSKVDAFQRQISALRHQLGGENDDEPVPDLDRPLSLSRDTPYLSEYPDFPSTGLERSSASRGLTDTSESRMPAPTPPPIQQSTSRPVSSLSQPRGGVISNRAVLCTSMGGWRVR